MNIKLFSNIDEIRKDWQNLQLSGKSYVFQSYEWVENYLSTTGKVRNEEPFLLSFSQTENDLPFLIIPLAIHTKNGLRYLVSIGGHLADFAGTIINGSLNNLVELRDKAVDCSI